MDCTEFVKRQAECKCNVHLLTERKHKRTSLEDELMEPEVSNNKRSWALESTEVTTWMCFGARLFYQSAEMYWEELQEIIEVWLWWRRPVDANLMTSLMKALWRKWVWTSDIAKIQRKVRIICVRCNFCTSLVIFLIFSLLLACFTSSFPITPFICTWARLLI